MSKSTILNVHFVDTLVEKYYFRCAFRVKNNNFYMHLLFSMCILYKNIQFLYEFREHTSAKIAICYVHLVEKIPILMSISCKKIQFLCALS